MSDIEQAMAEFLAKQGAKVVAPAAKNTPRKAATRGAADAFGNAKGEPCGCRHCGAKVVSRGLCASCASDAME